MNIRILPLPVINVESFLELYAKNKKNERRIIKMTKIMAKARKVPVPIEIVIMNNGGAISLSKTLHNRLIVGEILQVS